jgi:hypothetical protein
VSPPTLLLSTGELKRRDLEEEERVEGIEPS